MLTIVEVGSVLGKNLTPEEVEIINAARFKEFGSPVPVNPTPGKDDYNKLYFLARVNGKIEAFGRLHDVTVTLGEKKYPVYGIATIVSVEKHKGYGKKLMTGIKNFIENSERTGLGFCSKNISPFYRKCGFTLLLDGQKRFTYTSPPRFSGSDAFYIDGSDGLMQTLLADPHAVAKLSRPHW